MVRIEPDELVASQDGPYGQGGGLRGLGRGVGHGCRGRHPACVLHPVRSAMAARGWSTVGRAQSRAAEHRRLEPSPEEQGA